MTRTFPLAAALALAASLALAQAPAASAPPATPPAGKLPVFTDVLPDSGITWKRSFGDHHLSNIVEGTGSGVCVLDYDGDGKLDLYFPQGRWDKTVSDNRGRDLIDQLSNALYRGKGGFKFEDVTEKAGVGGRSFAFGCSSADYDEDGDEDLLVLTYKGPELYRNEGNGRFTDVTKAAGVQNDGGRAMSAIAADLNNDGWMDVYVANDSMENYYYENKGDGTFAEKGLELGLALGQNGQGVSSMGPAVADLDADGHLDIMIPDMDYGSLLSKKGGFYQDLIGSSGLGVILGQYTGWGAVLFDYDNDSHTDMFIANGNAHHEYTEDPVLVRNDGRGKFQDVARGAGDYFQVKWVGRGATWGDFDDDGNVDLVVVDTSGLPHLLRNGGGTANTWLKVDARAKGGTRTAIGARVSVVAGGRTQFQDVIGVNGYLSQGDRRAHFGLGKADKIDLVQVRWADGTTDEWKDVRPNQVLRVEQGKK